MTVILDKNVITDIARGNVAVAEALKRLLNSREPVFIATAARDELLNTGPTLLRDGYRAILNDLKLEAPPKTTITDRGSFHADNVQVEPQYGMGPVKEYGGGTSKARPGDAFIAAETRSLKARLWTLDKNFAKRAANLGVTIAPESAISGISGVEDIAQARRLLGRGINFRLIADKLANIKIKLTNIKIGGRGAIRLVGNIGVTILFAIIGGWLQERRDKEAVKDGLERVQSEIDAKLAEPEFLARVADLQLRQDKGEKVYATYTVEVHLGKPYYLVDKYYDYPYGDIPTVWLLKKHARQGLDLSPKKIESQTTQKGHSGYGFFTLESFTRSTEVAVYSEEELETFRDLAADYVRRKYQLAKDPTNQVLTQEFQELRRQIVEAFGENVWVLEAEPAMPD